MGKGRGGCASGCRYGPSRLREASMNGRRRTEGPSLASARTGQHVVAQSATGGGAAGSGIAPHRTSEAGTGEARPRGGVGDRGRRMKPRGTSKSPRAQLREIFTATNLLGCTSGWQGRGLAGEGKRHATGGAPDGRSECTHTHTTTHHKQQHNPYHIVSRRHAGHSQYAYWSALLWVSPGLIN